VTQYCLEVQIVDRQELLLGWVVHVGQAHVRRETRRDLVAADRRARVHRGDDRDSLHCYEVQIGVVEALVADDLLQEGD